MITVENNLSKESRVWIYAADRFFNPEEVLNIQTKLEKFIENWNAHGDKLFASGQLFDNKFLVFFVDEERVKISGCSIDSSVGFVKGIEEEFNVDLFNRMQVNYLEEGEIQQCSINDFWARRKANIVTEDTIVYDNLVKTKADFETKWKVPFKESWHQEMWR